MPKTPKKWRVTFEVDQFMGRVWMRGEDGQSIDGWQSLEQEDEYIIIPGNAFIEDITPHPPLQDGYYLLKGHDRVQRRKSVFAGSWEEFNGTGWVNSPKVGPTSENGLYDDLIFLGKFNPGD